MEYTNQIIKNISKQIFPSCISSKTHKIFLKYSSSRYRKYCLDLIRTLSQKLDSPKSKSIFYQTIIYQDLVLYNCGNEVLIHNLDLLILCCFSISIKTLCDQYNIPSLNKLKSLIREKYYLCKDHDIISTEIECLRLIDYNINYMNAYDFLKYFIGENEHLMELANSLLENIIYGDIKYYIFKSPHHLALEIYNKVKEKMKMKSMIISVPPTKKVLVNKKNANNRNERTIRENKEIKFNYNKKLSITNYSFNTNSSTDIFSTQNSSNGNISKNCSPYENKNNNNQFTKNDYKRRVSEILNCSNTSKTLLGHINVRSSAHILGEKNECFSSRIGSPTHIETLEKKSINIDLKYLSTISKKWNFQKEFGNIKTLNSMNNLPCIKKKLKFDENNHNEVL